MYWLFGILFYLDAYLSMPGWSGEGLGEGLPTGQGNLPSLRSGGGEGRVSTEVGRKWEEGRKWKF